MLVQPSWIIIILNIVHRLCLASRFHPCSWSINKCTLKYKALSMFKYFIHAPETLTNALWTLSSSSRVLFIKKNIWITWIHLNDKRQLGRGNCVWSYVGSQSELKVRVVVWKDCCYTSFVIRTDPLNQMWHSIDTVNICKQKFAGIKTDMTRVFKHKDMLKTRSGEAEKYS